MEKSYIPKADENQFCDGINLCTVRKTEDGISKLGVKDLQGNIREELLENIINADEYNGKPIVRVYSSGHIFINNKKDSVYLVTVDKKVRIQHQFTGGSPLEEENKKVIFKEKGVYKFDLEKVRKNARIRTKNRTSVEVIEEYNKEPIVDWALLENKENGNIFYKLICLMHFVVKKYKGELKPTGKETVIGGSWYKIEDLPHTKNVSPNAYIMSKEALKVIKENNFKGQKKI